MLGPQRPDYGDDQRPTLAQNLGTRVEDVHDRLELATANVRVRYGGQLDKGPQQQGLQPRVCGERRDVVELESCLHEVTECLAAPLSHLSVRVRTGLQQVGRDLHPHSLDAAHVDVAGLQQLCHGKQAGLSVVVGQLQRLAANNDEGVDQVVQGLLTKPFK